MDLTIHEVAHLLNISESTLIRWLQEGSIPSYRIGGEYRFNRREIENWVMSMSVASDSGFYDNSDVIASGTLHFSLYRAIHNGGVFDDVAGVDKMTVIKNTVSRIAGKMELDEDVLSDMLLDRERLQPTGLNHGIGIPHTRDFLLNSHYDSVTVVFPSTTLDYGSLDGEPVHTLFFLFACDDKRHLNLRAKIALLANDPSMRDFLTTRPSRQALLERIKAWESKLQPAPDLTPV